MTYFYCRLYYKNNSNNFEDKNDYQELDDHTIHSHYNNDGDGNGENGGNNYIGERTLAVRVINDNWRLIREDLSRLNITPRNIKQFGKYRKLNLEIIYQISSNDQVKSYAELRQGSVIQRYQSHLEMFEVFRLKWPNEMEALRWNLVDEYTAYD